MRWRVLPSTIEGTLTVPGDKSIAHRALMVAALARGQSVLRSMPGGGDVLSTAACLRLLGTEITPEEDVLRVTGTGSLRAPAENLDAGNSGTTMRLLAGILAGQAFESCLTGDESLRRRPMNRVIEPLTRMGADIRAEAGKAPLVIHGRPLRGIEYALPVASAQVKSSLLFAGLFAEGETTVIEPVPTRDHTERMLPVAGIEVRRDGERISLQGGNALTPLNLSVPGDVSSAAFFLAGAALTRGEVSVGDVGVNPTRTGFLRVLERMGAQVQLSNERLEGGEPVATVAVRGRVLRAVTIEAEEVPLLVDELPLVVLLATQAKGTSLIRGAGELRLKETDRIATVAAALASLGADIDDLPDGFAVRGPVKLEGAVVSSHGDHRLAMMLAMAGSIARGETVVIGADAAAVSYPGFEGDFSRLGGSIAV